VSFGRPHASVVVRTFNSASTLTACLASLRRQTVQPEIIVVDSGSSDQTLEIAVLMADRIVELGDEPFTYGRALNRGAAVARAPIHFAVSSHCEIPRSDWIELALCHYERPDVAATNGQQSLPDGSPLTEVLYLRGTTELPNPLWGFSNHASSWREEIWYRERFNETMVASEDFEWSDRVLAQGFTIVFDPALTVPGHHRTAQGPLALYGRSYREFLGAAACRSVEAPTMRQSVLRWWSQHPVGAKRYRQWLSPYRIAIIGGRYMAGRSLRRADKRAAVGRRRSRSLRRRYRCDQSSVDVMYVASGTTQGHQRADKAMMQTLGDLGVSAVQVTSNYPLPARMRRHVWRSMLTIDLFEAFMLRRAARSGVRSYRPRAILYATSHAALLQPRRRICGPVGIRFDTPTRLSRTGRLFAVEHWLERRQFARARILIPWAPSIDPSLAAILPPNSRVVPLPIPLETSRGRRASERERMVVAYAGHPYKKGLDRVVEAWANVAPANHRLLITGIDREAGRWYLRDRGISEPPRLEWRGKVSEAEHRALTCRAEIYLAASRYEDYGLAQLEALADGSVLVTSASPGPFIALAMARELDARLVAENDGADAIADALRAAIDLTPSERDGYRRRAEALLRPLSSAQFGKRLGDEILPILLEATEQSPRRRSGRWEPETPRRWANRTT